MEEIWKIVPGIPLLEVSNMGRVRSQPYYIEMPQGGFSLRQTQATKGHISYSGKGKYARYQINFRQKSYMVAPLVCETFNGPRPFPNAETMHADENSLNNVTSNLSWGSRKQNANFPKYLEYCRKIGVNNLKGGSL